MESVREILENGYCRDLIKKVIANLEKEIAEYEEMIKEKYQKIEKEDEGTRAVCEVGIEVFFGEELEKKYKSLRYFKSMLKEPKEGSITGEDIQRAKEVPLDQVSDLQFRNAGANRKKAPCPFHTEKTSSFTYYTDQNSYHCYGCNENGDVISYVMKTRNLPFIEAVRSLI